MSKNRKPNQPTNKYARKMTALKGHLKIIGLLNTLPAPTLTKKQRESLDFKNTPPFEMDKGLD